MIQIAPTRPRTERKAAVLDPLADELAHGRISRRAHAAGEAIRCILQGAGEISGSNWCAETRIDPGRVVDLQIMRALSRARVSIKLWSQLEDLVGAEILNALRTALSQSTSLGAVARSLGCQRPSEEKRYKETFRRTLQRIADSGILDQLDAMLLK